MLDFARRAESGIYTNAKVEHFPGFSRITVADAPVFREPGWEAAKPHTSSTSPSPKTMRRRAGASAEPNAKSTILWL